MPMRMIATSACAAVCALALCALERPRTRVFIAFPSNRPGHAHWGDMVDVLDLRIIRRVAAGGPFLVTSVDVAIDDGYAAAGDVGAALEDRPVGSE